MKQELWLARGKDGWYNLHEEKPYLMVCGDFDSENKIKTFCPEIFHRLVEGARLRKGRKKRIKRILIELED